MEFPVIPHQLLTIPTLTVSIRSILLGIFVNSNSESNKSFAVTDFYSLPCGHASQPLLCTHWPHPLAYQFLAIAASTEIATILCYPYNL